MADSFLNRPTMSQSSADTTPDSQRTEDELVEIAVELARQAVSARSPGRSLGALVRWRYRNKDWSDAACDRLLELSFNELKALQRASKPASSEQSRPHMDGQWLTIEEAAELLHRSPETLKRRLRTREGRRDYGWPWWDGHRWQIPSPAVDPGARAAYMAGIPVEEPYRPPPFAES